MPWFHHILVHFPIAFAALAAVLSAAAVLRPSARVQELAWSALVLAALAAVAAATTGLLSADHFVDEGGDPRAVALHRGSALAGVALLMLSSGCGSLARLRASRALAIASALSVIAAAAVLLFAAHAGGEMLHHGLSPWSGGHSHGEHVHGDAHEAGPIDSSETGESGAAAVPGSSPESDSSAPPAAPVLHDGHEHSHEH